MFQEYKKLLTIGIPAYNEEKYIRQTIESCINQAGTVIVSDNASTDNTSTICQELAKIYPNLIYLKQSKNKGGTENFLNCLNNAQTKYFMWLGAHDYLDENYSTHMVHMLEHSNALGSYPASRAVDINGNEIGIYDCWFTERLASDSAVERVYALIAHLHECSAFFGIFQTKIMQQVGLKTMLGNDNIFLCNMAAHGRLVYCPRAIYNWRQTKYGISYDQAVKIWTQSLGNENNKINSSRKEMIFEQLKALKSAKSKGLFGYFQKLKLISKAKKKLRKRFGN